MEFWQHIDHCNENHGGVYGQCADTFSHPLSMLYFVCRYFFIEQGKRGYVAASKDTGTILLNFMRIIYDRYN